MLTLFQQLSFQYPILMLIEVIVAIASFAVVIGGFMQALNTGIVGTNRSGILVVLSL